MSQRSMPALCRAVILASAIALLASACASRSGGARPPSSPPPAAPAPPSAPPPAPPPQPPMLDSPEFRRNPALGAIGALTAYQRGLSGSGILVSIIDTGIDINSPEFVGRIDPRSEDLVQSGVVSPGQVRNGPLTIQDVNGHGSAVASILAAARNGVGMHGVAPLANLLIFRGDDNNDSLLILGPAIREGAARSIQAGARVINFSLGSTDPLARTQFGTLFNDTSQANIVSVIAAGNDGQNDPESSARAAIDASARGTVIVAGAVDDNNVIASFSNRAGLAAQFYLVAPGRLIRVPTLGGNGSELRNFSGTSAATPFISGAAALLREQWPQLSAAQTVEILLSSATDLGAPGVDPIYGRGLLNIAAAVQPMGPTSSATASGVSVPVGQPQGGQFPAATSLAFGPASPAFGAFAVLDAYGRDFSASLETAPEGSAFAADPAREIRPFEQLMTAGRALGAGAVRMRFESVDRRISDFDVALRADGAGQPGPHERIDRLSLAVSQPIGQHALVSVANGFGAREFDGLDANRATQHASLARDGFADPFLSAGRSAMAASMRFSLSAATQIDALASIADADDPWTIAPHDATPARRLANMRLGVTRRLGAAETARVQQRGADQIRFEAGVREEAGGVLGATFGGPLGVADRSVTVYQSASADVGIHRGWRASARASIGVTDAGALSGGFIQSVEALVSTHFAAALYRDGVLAAGDRLTASVVQPLRIETGAARLLLPTGYDPYALTFLFEDRRTPLGAGAREIDAELRYQRPVGASGFVEAAAIHQWNALGEGRAASAGMVRGGVRF